MDPLRVVVVGAGISGLAFAHRVQALAARARRPLQLSVLEASGHVGGVIRTLRWGDCLLESGPDCWAGNKPAGVELCRELGLESDLIGTRPGVRRSFVLCDGVLQRLPEGFFLISPMSVRALLATPLLSPLGKLRMGLELLIGPRAETGDESLAAFVRRRFGRQALARIAQPMIAGIYTADPEKLSLQATFPQFHEMERTHGSVIRALRAKAADAAGAELARAAGPRYGMFVTLKQGMGALPGALAAQLPPGALRVNSPVAELRREFGLWRARLGDGDELAADVLCLALPAHASARLLGDSAPELSRALGEIEYAGAAVVNFVFERGQIRHAMDGIGAVIPAAENRRLVAFSFSSVKFEGRAPAGRVVLRAFLGGALRPEIAALDAAELTRVALEELRDLVGISGQPLYSHAAGHRDAMAQYHVGHRGRVERIRAQLAARRGLCVIGNAFDGVGIPDCIRGAREAAESALRQAGMSETGQVSTSQLSADRL
ncbi:MAG: protoporphyrinogen oxidase [Planctomycetes bacterium]|jgi:oxygen-dependent protoporphyrinogen oxidase|nr:protoporphyrinogen oxidase [Planctomycetota bacterium]MCL4730364.1 protoporphyrinogen oxidase [Planctomycetota bacterium]